MIAPTGLETLFLRLVNADRVKAGAKPLTFDGELLAAADAHSAWMDRTDTFSHTGVQGSDPGERMASAGYGAQGWGENIAYVSGTLSEATVRQLHANLMASPGHHANIVRGSFQEIGIGLKEGTINGHKAVFVTEDFGTPNAAERAEPNDVGATPPPVRTISGTSGKDVLTGTAARDVMSGGAGHDVFAFGTASRAKGDVLKDFVHGADRISLKAIDANTHKSGNQAFTFIGQKDFHKVAGELKAVLSGHDTVVAGDVNGDGVADFTIKALGVHGFAKGDFIL